MAPYNCPGRSRGEGEKENATFAKEVIIKCMTSYLNVRLLTDIWMVLYLVFYSDICNKAIVQVCQRVFEHL